MSKHTPGPWSVSNGQVMSEYAIKAECRGSGFGSSVAIVTQRDGQNPLPHDEAMANARLIAAAPELLDALRGMLAIVENSRGVAGYHLNGDTAEWDEFDEIDIAHTAIAKATGETQ